MSTAQYATIDEIINILRNINNEDVNEDFKNNTISKIKIIKEDNNKDIDIYDLIKTINFNSLLNQPTFNFTNLEHKIKLLHIWNIMYLIQLLMIKYEELNAKRYTSVTSAICTSIKTLYELIIEPTTGNIKSNITLINTYKTNYDKIISDINALSVVSATFYNSIFIEYIDTNCSHDIFLNLNPTLSITSPNYFDTYLNEIKMQRLLNNANFRRSFSSNEYDKLYIINLLNVNKYTLLLNELSNKILNSNVIEKIESLKEKVKELKETFKYDNIKGTYKLNNNYIEYNNNKVSIEFENYYNNIIKYLNIYIGLLRYPKLPFYKNNKEIFNSWSLFDYKKIPQEMGVTNYSQLEYYDNLDKKANNDIILNNINSANDYLYTIAVNNYNELFKLIKKNSQEIFYYMIEIEIYYVINSMINILKSDYNLIRNEINYTYDNYKNKYFEIYNKLTKGANLETFQNSSNSSLLNSAIDELINNLKTQNLQNINDIERILTNMKNNSIKFLTIGNTLNLSGFATEEIYKKINPLVQKNQSYHDKAKIIFDMFKTFLTKIINIKINNENINILSYREDTFTTNSFTVRGYCATDLCNIQNILSKIYNNIAKSMSHYEYSDSTIKNSNLLSNYNQLIVANGSFQKVFNKFISKIKNKTKETTSKTYIIYKRLIILYLSTFLMNMIIGFKKQLNNISSSSTSSSTTTASSSTTVSENNYTLAKSMISNQNESTANKKNSEARAYIHALLSVVNDVIPKISRKQIPILVKNTKREINNMLRDKNMKVSNSELSNIVNQILGAQKK